MNLPYRNSQLRTCQTAPLTHASNAACIAVVGGKREQREKPGSGGMHASTPARRQLLTQREKPGNAGKRRSRQPGLRRHPRQASRTALRTVATGAVRKAPRRLSWVAWRPASSAGALRTRPARQRPVRPAWGPLRSRSRNRLRKPVPQPARPCFRRPAGLPSKLPSRRHCGWQ